MSTNTLEQLKAAGDRALAGLNPWDTFKAYGLSLDEAALWVQAWVDELTDQAVKIGEDPESRDFVYRVALGCLATGVEHGQRLRRRQDRHVT